MKKNATTVRFRIDPKKPPKLTAKQRKRLEAMRDEDIDYSDIPELNADFFRLAKALTPAPKHSLTLRLDEEVYQWLKEQGPGYQSRINAILKAVMLIQEQQV